MVTSEVSKAHYKQMKAIEDCQLPCELHFIHNQSPSDCNSYWCAANHMLDGADHLFFFDKMRWLNTATILNFLQGENCVLYSNEYNIKKSVGLIHQAGNLLNFDYKSRDKWMGLVHLDKEASAIFQSIAFERSWYKTLMPSEGIAKLNERYALKAIAYESIVSL
jgi:hypothetical protein